MDTVLLAVNGTLMRGLKLNKNLTSVGGEFIREDKTDSCYKLWTIGDEHPAMVRVREGGTNIQLEIWKVPKEGLVSILLNEPAGLSIGKVMLKDKTMVLGVIAEPILCEDQLEITEFRGWHNYINRNKSI
jgi:hypothetical protein